MGIYWPLKTKRHGHQWAARKSQVSMFIIMIFQTVMFFFLDGWSPPLFNIGKRGKTVIIIVIITFFFGVSCNDICFVWRINWSSRRLFHFGEIRVKTRSYKSLSLFVNFAACDVVWVILCHFCFEDLPMWCYGLVQTFRTEFFELCAI